MTVDGEGGDGGPPHPDDIDIGEPIRALSEIGLEPRKGFFDKLRRKIERRSFTSHLATFTWEVPRLFLLEMLALIFQFFDRPGRDQGDPHD